MQNRRIQAIDIAKGIAILLVVFGHALQSMVVSTRLGFDTAWSSIYIAQTVIYSFHMPAFFMLSGLFVDNWLKKPMWLAFWNKVKRLVYPYVVWSIIGATVMQCAIAYTNGGLGFKELKLAMVVPFSEYWYLYVLFSFFMVYLIFAHVFGPGYKPFLLVLSFGLFLMYPYLPDFWILIKFSKFFVFFALGTYLVSYFEKIQTKQHLAHQLGLCGLAFLLVEFIYIILLRVDYLMIANYFWFVTAIGGTALLFCLAKWLALYTDMKIIQFLTQAGFGSMRIYVIHLFPLAGTRLVLLDVLKLNNLWLITTLVFVMAVVISYIGLHLITTLHLNCLLFAEND